MLSYVIAGLLGGTLAVLYWAGINSIYSRIFPTENKPQPDSHPLAVSPQTFPTAQPQATATPLVDVIIDADKQLHFENNGPTPIEDVRVFATEYVLDMRAFSNKEIAIERYQRLGGTVVQISSVPPHSHSAPFNLSTVSFLSFPEFTGVEKGLEFFKLLTRHYCLRITFRDPSGQKHVGYRVTSAVRGGGAPSFYENPDDVTVLASPGQSTHMFLHDIPALLIRHEKTLPGGEDAKEYVFPSSVVKW